MEHDDILDACLYALQEYGHRKEKTSGEKTPTKSSDDELIAMLNAIGEYERDKSGREKAFVDHLCENARKVCLWQYDDKDATIYLARLNDTNYILSQDAYQKVRRAIWNTRD